MVFRAGPTRDDRLSATKMEARVRYVIAVCIVTGFLIWDGAYNNGHYLDMLVRELRNLARLVGI